MDIFPISVIWLLATEAKFPLIKEKAQERLNRILDQYGYQIKELTFMTKMVIFSNRDGMVQMVK